MRKKRENWKMHYANNALENVNKEELKEIKARIVNWRRAFIDRPIKNISITFAVERALALTRNKTDFSEDYTGEDVDGFKPYPEPIDYQDAEILERVWCSLGTNHDKYMLVAPNSNLTLQRAKEIVFVYTFGRAATISSLAGIYGVSDKLLDRWVIESLLFFRKRVNLIQRPV